jgi:hypothetical protein
MSAADAAPVEIAKTIAVSIFFICGNSPMVLNKLYATMLCWLHARHALVLVGISHNLWFLCRKAHPVGFSRVPFNLFERLMTRRSAWISAAPN